MKAVHPFPARMAPDTLSDWIDALPAGSNVLDPMCGSGVVLRQSLLAGHRSTGFDIDPLAVLMSRVWTTRIALGPIVEEAERLCAKAQALPKSRVRLPWIRDCIETQEFIGYWFAQEQREALSRLSVMLQVGQAESSKRLAMLLWLALSRVIVTKQAGASLAWDVSHSRPHKVREDNDFDVYHGFCKAVKAIVAALEDKKLPRDAKVKVGDGRNMSSIPAASIDAIFSSPPYLNAIDYLRGHKFSLVWMGYTIPELRRIRSTSIGAERAPDHDTFVDVWRKVMRRIPALKELDRRRQRMVQRYVYDAMTLMAELSRVAKPGAKLGLVLGDSSIRGTMVENSRIYDTIAGMNGFARIQNTRRLLEDSKRYLPHSSKTNSLERRMRYETIQIYEAHALA